MTSDGSITQCLNALERGDPEAAQRIWNAYVTRLVDLARARLSGVPRRAADEEDEALSASDSFWRGAQRGRFARLDDRDDPWQLRMVITIRKARNSAKHERLRSRAGGQVRMRTGPAPCRDDDLPGVEPSPEPAALGADECRRLSDAPLDESLRQVAQLRPEGYNDLEIATELDRGLSTVKWRLRTIRTVRAARG
jgi:DNA-directed RNA polymerase specialized sigma24 family protein